MTTCMTQLERVGALVAHHLSGSWQGHPRYTGARTREGRRWPDQRPKAGVTSHDASLKHDNRQVLRHTFVWKEIFQHVLHQPNWPIPAHRDHQLMEFNHLAS